MKRGTDHWWQVNKYIDNLALFAKCKCGFEYNCGRNKRNDDGSPSLEQYPAIMYQYCPRCGARKKWYNEEPNRVNKYCWE